MALVKIDKITLCQSTNPDVWMQLSVPEPGHKEDMYSIGFTGWIRSKESNFKSLTLRDPISNNASMHPLLEADAARWIEKILAKNKQYFSFSVGVIGFSLEFDLILSGTLGDDSVVKLAKIKGTRHPVRSSFTPSLQPLILNSLGRTGTTMLMRLLSAHQQIVAQKVYPYEVRASNYWMHFLKVLSAPYSGPQQNRQNFLNQQSRIVSNLTNDPIYTTKHQVKKWVDVRYVENMAAFCQQSVEEYYLSVAESQEETDSMYFVEKYSPNHIPSVIWELYPKAREIILVRDFRDMLSSINAFNAKMGELWFGRKRVLTDEEYVERLGHRDIRSLHRAWIARRGKVHLVRYEDIILKPMETVRSMLQYLSLEHSDDTITKMLSAVTAIDDKEERERTEAHKTSKSPEDSIGRWKKDLSPSVQSLCKKEFGHILEDFGYSD
jgi:hypothetical protein